MRLGEILVAEKLVDLADVESALQIRQRKGGDLPRLLLEMGAIGADELQAVQARRPNRPKSIEETGLTVDFLVSLLLKTLYVRGINSASEVTDELKLPALISQQLLDHLRERRFIEPLGVVPGGAEKFEAHFTLSDEGRTRALQALEQSSYIGPAPVPIAEFEAQIRKQELAGDNIDEEKLKQGLSHLMISQSLVDKLGPSLNSKQPMLLYGPPGNGKSSIAHAAIRCFSQLIHIPYCIEVDSQIVKVFDPALHEEVTIEPIGEADQDTVRQSSYDQRWVSCRRPRISTGVELTLEMLDLNFHPSARFYDAPLQMKAVGGALFINDFGSQLTRPIDIISRWIVPLEHGSDYLTLETGRKFSYTFDALLIFSTNLLPAELLDSNLARRIPFKIGVDRPSREEFVSLLKFEFEKHDLDLSAELASFLLKNYYDDLNRPFARYHPRVIVDRIKSFAKYKKCAVQVNEDILSKVMLDL